MAHFIQGLVARFRAPIYDSSGTTPGLCPLQQGFAFQPTSKVLVYGNNGESQLPHFSELTEQLRLWVESESFNYPIAYVETEYFGGDGIQAAVVWKVDRFRSAHSRLAHRMIHLRFSMALSIGLFGRLEFFVWSRQMNSTPLDLAAIGATMPGSRPSNLRRSAYRFASSTIRTKSNTGASTSPAYSASLRVAGSLNPPTVVPRSVSSTPTISGCSSSQAISLAVW
jgi:hypothetical protein